MTDAETSTLRRLLRRVHRMTKGAVDPDPATITTMAGLKRAIQPPGKAPPEFPHPDGTARERWLKSGSRLSFRDWCIKHIDGTAR